jgi:hypothetical protein
MDYTYTEIKDEQGVLIGLVRNEDKAGIPIDPANSDYQRYLRWVENPDAEENADTVGL